VNASGKEVAIAILVALAASCGGEMVEKEIDVGFQGEALRNPLLAAQVFARESGFAVDTTVVLEQPSDEIGVVVVAADEFARRSELHAPIAEWVANGGALVLTVYGLERPAAFDDALAASVPLFERFGVVTEESYAALLGEVDDIDEFEDFEVLEALPEEWGLATQLRLGYGAYGELEVDFETGPDLALEPDRDLKDVRGRFGSRNAAYAFLFADGAGHVLFLATGSPLWNGALAEADNAEFLARVLALGGGRGVVFVHGRDETLWTLLMERAPWFTWIAIALVILALWRFGGRFGPPIVEPAAARHAFAQHVLASGRFVWRRAGAPALVAPLRRRVVRLAARASAVDSADGAAIAAALERTSGAPLERITSDLEGSVPRDPARFTALVERLHELESVHDRHARTEH
jgi:hypothetical protein